jgi:ParB/RepB/Spo0J family partition protein
VLIEVELDKLEPNPDQPRQWIDPEKVEELAASISSRGARQPDNPIQIRPTPAGDRFVIISGERRWRAKQLLRERAPEKERNLWNTIKALLRDDVDDELSAFMALDENLQREDLSAAEEGAAYARLMEKFQLSARALAERIGKDERRVQSMVRLNTAPKFLKDALMKGILVEQSGAGDATPSGKPKRTRRRLEFRAGVEFMRLHDHLLGRDPNVRENPNARQKIEERVSLWVERALSDGWTVRRVEEHCGALRAGRKPAAESKAAMSLPKAALDVSADKIIVHRAQLGSLPADEREALVRQLLALLEESAGAGVEGRVHVDETAAVHAAKPAAAGATEG